MKATGRRRPKDSIRPPPPPAPSVDHHRQFSRDSDASFASSRPSSLGINRSSAGDALTDRSYQLSAIRTINSFLASHSSPLSLKPPLPSAKDISETLKFLISQLDFPTTKLEDDLPILLKHLNCPIKLNKSALKAPGTPHAWPPLLGVMHWLVQIALYNDHLVSNLQCFDNTFVYALDSYLHYIRGDDDGMEAVDREFMGKLEKERDAVAEGVKALEKEVAEREGRLEELRSGPSAKEVVEKVRGVLEEDVKKFHAIIAEFSGRIASVEKILEEKEKELGVKVEENNRICEENEELKKRVELQTFNARDAERMKRELQAVERDITEAEVARNGWEEKSWDLDTTIGHKFKELEALSIECNQALRRLKLGNGLQYVLNAKGSSPTEVLGIDYKSALKPALDSFADDINKSSMSKLEELISLQQQSVENAAKIEAKRNRLAALQSRSDEVEAQLNFLKKETQNYTSRCAMEAKKLVEDVEIETHNVDIVEREVADVLETSKLKLQEAIKQNEEEIQICAWELYALVDSVSKYKEHMASKISEMKSNLSETAGAVSDSYKGSLSAQFGITLDTSH
ncbi:hypothetical protein VitviT2T_018569 [Vitis vinifera]|uniref:Kinetochore protein NDC80 n=2 Tax=Vitis vinifera TaxID=29760 RepID=A0ABY9CYF3_VITVI|nr:kinetochore protein NDC80 homolog [Vitis vinifera]WKA00185.1 hypothetical protein VitviT2T_018569 [Vitis vinifera]|eukprot:XP_002273942.1 PREDICTED: kinetochore protein ndc80 [Vitis vinifera]